MIFVVFGNVPIPFLRLAEKINAISEQAVERFVIQKGYTDYTFFNAQAHDFFSGHEMAKLINEASLIVSHGGYGTLSEVMKMGKKVVAVPRLAGEHNHSQLELVEALEKEGYLLGVYEIADLERKIAEARNFVPSKFKSGNAGEIINQFILEKFS